MPTTYEPIATTTLGADTASFVLSSIPSTYTDLRLNIVPRGSSSLAIYARFNGDTATNYSYTNLYGNGSSTASGRQSGTTSLYLTPNIDVAISPNWSLVTCDIFSYTNSTYKSTLITNSGDRNGSGGVEFVVGLWRSTSAINSITILALAGNITAGTVATLYGIKAA